MVAVTINRNILNCYMFYELDWFGFTVFNTTFNNISVVWWRYEFEGTKNISKIP
jgi:hypothetical protein